MANLTIIVDDDLLRQARKKALDRGESVNQVLGQKLREYAHEENRHRRALRDFVKLAEAAGKRPGERRGGRTWRRDDLHAR